MGSVLEEEGGKVQSVLEDLQCLETTAALALSASVFPTHRLICGLREYF